jgi:hypothetical protein
MADEPISGFGGRIVARARLPVATLLALPFIGVAIEYFFFLVQSGKTWVAALGLIEKDFSLFIFLGSIPPIALAFARELQLHDLLDRAIFGTRADVAKQIADLMAKLAESSGYDNSEKIKASPEKAREWFYVYANEQNVLRIYAFELWEGYFVGLYLWIASAASLITCGLLAFFFQSRILAAFSILSGIIFFAEWAIRRWFTVPKILQLPAQQVAQIHSSSDILNEAKRRFG